MDYTLEVRKVAEDQFDGSTGAKIETAESYQLGAVIDGQFVPFVTKSAPYIDALVARAKETAQAETPAQPSGEGSGSGSGQGGGGGTA